MPLVLLAKFLRVSKVFEETWEGFGAKELNFKGQNSEFF